MKKINSAILSIPPYISTSWKNVASLHLKYNETKPVVVVTLLNGSEVEVPNLDKETIDAIFNTHSEILEKDASLRSPSEPFSGQPLMGFNLPFNMQSSSFENFATLLQHNVEQKDAPDLPKEVLAKVGSLSKALGIDDPHLIAAAEPHCNCPYCQIARAMHVELIKEEGEEKSEELITEQDLKFRDWNVRQSAEKLYLVTNPIDNKEYYNVFLGDAIGCTCGQKNCEHIRAVLNS